MSARRPTEPGRCHCATPRRRRSRRRRGALRCPILPASSPPDRRCGLPRRPSSGWAWMSWRMATSSVADRNGRGRGQAGSCRDSKNLRVVFAQFGRIGRGCGRCPSNETGRPTTRSSLPGSVRIMSIACNCSDCGQVGDVIDRGDRHAGLADDAQPVAAGVLQQHGLHDRGQCLAVGGPLAAIGKPRIGRPFRAAHRPRQFHEQPVVAGGDADRPVGGLEDLIRSERRAGRAMPLRQLAGDAKSCSADLAPRPRRSRTTRYRPRSLCRWLTLLQRGERADHAPHAGRRVIDRRRAEGWRIVGPAGQRHHRAIALQQRIEPGRHLQWPLMAKSPDRAVDQPRVEPPASSPDRSRTPRRCRAAGSGSGCRHRAPASLTLRRPRHF